MKKIIIYILLVTGFSTVSGQAVKIDIHIPNLKNQDVILGHNFNDQLLPDDTITLNSKGFGTFLRNEQYPGGMYFLFLPNSRKFDFLLDKDQQFSMFADTSDYLKTVTFKGSEENTIFLEFQKNMESRAIEMKKLSDARVAAKGNKQKVREIDSLLNDLYNLKKDDFDKVINSNPDLFLSKFLKATMQVEIPKTIKGRQAQYYYYRNHYFDNFDISDPRLLRTPIYMSTIDRYIDKLLMQHPDTLIPEVDMLIEKSKTNEELLRFMLVHLFNKYSSSQIITSENVMVHIAEKYYTTDLNTWSDPKFISELKAKLRKKKNCLIGNVAKDIDFRILNVDTFNVNKLLLENKKLKEEGLKIEKSEADSIVKHNMKVELIKEFFFEFEETGSLFTTDAEYTIIWFWTPDCSHCRKDTPEFYDMYMEKKLYEKNVRVIAVFMQKDIADWKKFAKINEDWLNFIKEHEMSKWIHSWNPFDTFRRNFDIESSPVLYLLDKNKEIIAKKVAYKQAFEIIEAEMKRKQK